MQTFEKFLNYALDNDAKAMIKGGTIRCAVTGGTVTFRGDCGDLQGCTEQCVADYGDSCYGCYEILG